jgi:hypothetical protein
MSGSIERLRFLRAKRQVDFALKSNGHVADNFNGLSLIYFHLAASCLYVSCANLFIGELHQSIRATDHESGTRTVLCPNPSVIQKPITIQSKQKIKATGKGADTTQ